MEATKRQIELFLNNDVAFSLFHFANAKKIKPGEFVEACIWNAYLGTRVPPHVKKKRRIMEASAKCIQQCEVFWTQKERVMQKRIIKTIPFQEFAQNRLAGGEIADAIVPDSFDYVGGMPDNVLVILTMNEETTFMLSQICQDRYEEKAEFIEKMYREKMYRGHFIEIGKMYRVHFIEAGEMYRGHFIEACLWNACLGRHVQPHTKERRRLFEARAMCIRYCDQRLNDHKAQLVKNDWLNAMFVFLAIISIGAVFFLFFSCSPNFV